MTTQECLEIIASADTGATFNDESRANPNFLIGVLNAGRAFIIRERYFKGQDIHPNFKMLVYPKYDALAQESDCYTTFNLERAIDVNDIMDGYLSCSPINEEKTSFKRIKSRQDYSNMTKNRVSRGLLEREIFWFPDPSSNRLFIYHPASVNVKKIKYEIIPEEPTKVEGFNIEKDDYPITMEALKRVEELVRNGTIYGYLKIRSNVKSNSQDDSQIQAEQ